MCYQSPFDTNLAACHLYLLQGYLDYRPSWLCATNPLLIPIQLPVTYTCSDISDTCSEKAFLWFMRAGNCKDDVETNR